MTLSGAFDQPKAAGSQKILGMSPFILYGILAAVVGIGGAAAIYFTQVQPASERVAKLQSEVEAINNEIRQKEAALRDRAKVEAELKQAEEQRAKLETIFGNQQDLQVALLMIDQQIRDSGATLRLFKPGAVVTAGQVDEQTPGTAQRRPTQAQVPAEQTMGLLKKVTYDVEFQGTYPQTVAVLRNIERLRLLLNITKFSMQAPTSRSEDGETPRLTTKFTLEAFVPLTPEELAARKQAAQAQPQQGRQRQDQRQQQQQQQ
ncbi:MAG: GspMb/PilO family protein [Gloeomargarita sp. HHBFW_bins_162]